MFVLRRHTCVVTHTRLLQMPGNWTSAEIHGSRLRFTCLVWLVPDSAHVLQPDAQRRTLQPLLKRVLSVKARRSGRAPPGRRRTHSRMSVFQNPVIVGSAILSDHVCAAIRHMCLCQTPGKWTSVATQGSHLVQSNSLARRGKLRTRRACRDDQTPNATHFNCMLLIQAVWFLRHTRLSRAQKLPYKTVVERPCACVPDSS